MKTDFILYRFFIDFKVSGAENPKEKFVISGNEDSSFAHNRPVRLIGVIFPDDANRGGGVRLAAVGGERNLRKNSRLRAPAAPTVRALH